ncbi:MAG: DUF2807 domain-containing protein [Bacteroidales bacterium]|nr:DUF2807 domain-containing protein [Bacteroidales bacterium]
MKTRQLVIWAFSILLISSLFPSCEDCITGNGQLTSKNVTIGEIRDIRLSGDANLLLISDSVDFLKIEGESNVIETYVFDESGGTLKIKSNKCILGSEQVTITIPVRVLESLSINGSGNIRSNSRLRAGDLELSINGSGDIDLDIEAENIVSKINGSGAVILRGSSKNERVNVNGSGDVDASGLAAGKVSVTINGSGDCKVMATTALNVEIRGSGNVYYKGSPDVSTEIKGSGSVMKLE